MPRPRLPLYADLPADLHEADDLLHLYGRWAVGSRGGARRCGSAEGLYIPERGAALEARRDPKREGLHIDDAMRAQRALTAVPDRERIVLTILYVPRRMPAEQQLRILRIPPQLSQQRHLAGVRYWWNRWGVLGKGG